MSGISCIPKTSRFLRGDSPSFGRGVMFTPVVEAYPFAGPLSRVGACCNAGRSYERSHLAFYRKHYLGWRRSSDCTTADGRGRM